MLKKVLKKVLVRVMSVAEYLLVAVVNSGPFSRIIACAIILVEHVLY